jgi:uncharacterized protein (UPF0303 family)
LFRESICPQKRALKVETVFAALEERGKNMGLNEDLQRIAEQERELQLTRLDATMAWELGGRVRALAESRGMAVVIDVRRFGQPLFYTALDGTTPDHAEWVRRKSNVVARFHRSSYSVGLRLAAQNETLLSKYDLPIGDYASHGGSFPLSVVGAGVIGSVTVSGVPQRGDHELVVEGLCGLLGRDYEVLKLDAE